MTRDGTSHPISDFHLERFALGELPPDMLRKLEARLSSDSALRDRLDAILAHERQFKTAFPAAGMVPRIKTAAESPAPLSAQSPLSPLSPPSSFSRPATRPPAKPSLSERFPWGFRPSLGWRIAGAFTILLLVAVPIVLLKQPLTTDTATDEVRLKGMQPELRLHRNTPAGPERLASGAAAAAGDVIQIEFHPGDYPYGAIVSVDGSGSVTLHWPKGPDTGTALSAFRKYRLPEAFRLDAAPKFERFHLLLSRKPIDLKAAGKLLTASAGRSEDWLASQVPESVCVVTFTLAK